jgi:hypothetical protein
MLRKVPVVVHALVEDYGSGDFKYCDSECPFMELAGEMSIYCRLGDEREMIGQDEVAELRCQKCRENEALLTAPPDRDDAAMRDGVRVEATKDEKVNGIVRLCQDVDWTNISLMLDYLERIGSAWPHATGQLRPFVLGIRSALAEVEGK